MLRPLILDFKTVSKNRWFLIDRWS